MSRKTGTPSYTRSVAPDGKRSRTQVQRVLVGLILAVTLGVLAGMQIAGPSASEAAIADARQAEAARDLNQIRDLTEQARDTKTAIEPVVTGLADVTGTPDRPVDEAQVQKWTQRVKERLDLHTVSVSGTTSTNVARGGFRIAVAMLAAAVDTYAAARGVPVQQRALILELADRQRRQAVSAWSVAATQLDQLNVWAGNGHQHVYLTDNSQGGAMTPDGTPEGTVP